MLEAVLYIGILVVSVIVHELAHGYMADALGDHTARHAGRLTLNPFAHLDLYGSLIVPIITAFLGFPFGWAKPVPYNPYNLKNKRVGELLIAFAGPATNLMIALIFGILMRLVVIYQAPEKYLEIMVSIVLINIVLAVFNLIPLPPLDGSTVLFSLFPRQYGKLRVTLEMYSPFFMIVVVFFLWRIIQPIIPVIFRFFTGI